VCITSKTSRVKKKPEKSKEQVIMIEKGHV
jgi:hypothetical protein